jgi:PD-(D/E)XK nuclease superfamily
MTSKTDLHKWLDLIESAPHFVIQTEWPQTFLEIAGYPQLENVASNILGFFFDSREEHQLQSVFVQSLLESAGLDEATEDLQVDDVKREVHATGRTRIDLVISTSTLLIGIENKLLSGLNNDLDLYMISLRSKAGERKPVGILLSLDPIPPSKHKDVFIPVTYDTFFENIRRNLGRVVVGANQRYLPLLFDFIQTMEHLRQEPAMPDQEYRTWVAEHQIEISTLLQEIDHLKRQLAGKINKLKARVDLGKYENTRVKIKPWVYDAIYEKQIAQILVCDFDLPNGLTFAMDVILNPIEWKITILAREKRMIKAYESFFNKISSLKYKNIAVEGDTDVERRRLVGDKLDFDADLSVVAEKVQDLMDKIVAQAKKQGKNTK